MTCTFSVVTFVFLGLTTLVASTASTAQDNAVKQLEATADYKEAQRASSTEATPKSDVLQNADQLTHDFNMRRETNKVYEIVILSTLALVSLFLVLRFLTAKTAYSATHIVNASGLVCIIWGTILLVLMAQTDQQMTAAVGILGAVAGYLFRSIQREEVAREK